ncbi:MAG: ATP-binding protein, partial [Dehalococcoidales bacterium]|nr:ATP-binding protein [Dehalococcoidales bacterium]
MPELTFFHMVIALVATLVIHPLGGLVVAGLAVTQTIGIALLKPDLVGAAQVWQTGVYSLLAVGAAWTLVHRLYLVLQWYADSYVEADRKTQEAREHRAELVEARKQLSEAYRRLERANAALTFAWRVADTAERSKTEFVTNISHELRTPLNLIVGYSEMMMTSPASYGGEVLPLAYRGDLNAIYRGAQHLLALTEDVLDLARFETGHLSLAREPVDLGQVVADATALVREYIESKGLQLQLTVTPDLPTLMLDRLRIRQVMLNLLTNAARFTEHGHVSVRVVRHEKGVQVIIADTGPGIAADRLAGMFNRFVTQDLPRQEWRGGVGLGLPLSKQFVELHGGELGAESTVGIGTKIWFTIPTVHGDGQAAKPAGRKPAPWYALKDEQVLVLLHSDPALARVLQRHLDGFRVESADTLAEAVARALVEKALAIVADIDDYEEGETGSVPVVLCPLPDPVRLRARLGVADYLTKPISRAALLQAIDALGKPIERIVIADDDQRFVRFVERTLRSHWPDLAIASAFSGDEALSKVRATKPDLLLLDLSMHGLDGMGVLSALGQDAALDKTAVMILSAQQESEGGTPIGREFR